MRIPTFILLAYLLAFKAAGQSTRFCDSAGFFIRTKTKEIRVVQKSQGKAFRTTTAYFDRQHYSLVWCSKLMNLPLACEDTVYFDHAHGDVPVDPTTRYFWDKHQRLVKTEQKDESGGIATTEYIYADSLSRKLTAVLGEMPDGTKLMYGYHYEKDRLIHLFESIYGPAKGNASTESHRTYTYGYYPDRRVKTETVETNGKREYVSEFVYVDDTK